jgi:hypothetical protein
MQFILGRTPQGGVPLLEGLNPNVTNSARQRISWRESNSSSADLHSNLQQNMAASLLTIHGVNLYVVSNYSREVNNQQGNKTAWYERIARDLRQYEANGDTKRYSIVFNYMTTDMIQTIRDDAAFMPNNRIEERFKLYDKESLCIYRNRVLFICTNQVNNALLFKAWSFILKKYKEEFPATYQRRRLNGDVEERATGYQTYAYDDAISEALYNLNGEKFEELYRAWHDQYFNPIMIARKEMEATIAQMPARMIEGRRVGAQRLVDTQKQTVDQCKDQYDTAWAKLIRYQNDLLGLMNGNNNTDELCAYLLRRAGIKGVRFDTGREYDTLNITYFLPCDNYDKAMLNRILSNPRSYPCTHTGMKDALETIFLNDDFQLWFHQSVYFSTNPAQFRLGAAEHKSPIPYGTHNPHIQWFICFGSYYAYIEKAICDMDYCRAVDILASSVSSFNWSDGPVVDHLLRHWNDRDGYHDDKCIYQKSTRKWFTYREIRDKAHIPAPAPEPTPAPVPVPVPVPVPEAVPTMTPFEEEVIG